MIFKTKTYIDYRELARLISEKLGGDYDPNYVRSVHKGIQKSTVIMSAIDKLIKTERSRAA